MCAVATRARLLPGRAATVLLKLANWQFLVFAAACYPDGEIARILNRQKRVTARGLPYTASRVAALRGRHGIAVCPPSEADASGVPALSVSEAAAELGVTGTTLYRWIRKGLVPSVHPEVSGACHYHTVDTGCVVWHT